MSLNALEDGEGGWPVGYEKKKWVNICVLIARVLASWLTLANPVKSTTHRRAQHARERSTYHLRATAKASESPLGASLVG